MLLVLSVEVVEQPAMGQNGHAWAKLIALIGNDLIRGCASRQGLLEKKGRERGKSVNP